MGRSRKWTMIAGFIDGFGEVVFEADSDEWGNGGKHVTIRRLSMIQITREGQPAFAKWHPLHFELVNHILTLDRSRLSIVTRPTEELERKFGEVWNESRVIAPDKKLAVVKGTR